ncbi:MAG: ral stress protein [Candidatus Adlerbacteria bacterium]|nr:ral stress protein [Candidatus Adlerbacteria bacterium]
MEKNNNESKGRGFASMDEDKQREIASQGGKAAHEKGTAHEFSSEEAREAGRKGGQARQGNNQEGGDSSNSEDFSGE